MTLQSTSFNLNPHMKTDGTTLTFSYIPCQLVKVAEKVTKAIDPLIDFAGLLAGAFDAFMGNNVARRLHSAVNIEYQHLKSDVPKFKFLTALNILGYIPLVRIIFAVVRVIFAHAFAPLSLDSPTYRKAQSLRAFIECIPLSQIPLAITDGVVTAKYGLYA